MAQCDGILHVSFTKFVLYFVVLLLGAFDLCIPPYVFFFPLFELHHSGDLA